MECVIFFWATFAVWLGGLVALWATGSVICALCLGVPGALVGAFGHNWVHQPKYKFWALLSLDTLGFSSTGWFREHNMQHHMYTNTPWDNHFHGTEPFLVTDPTKPRNLVQAWVLPYITPVLLCFGIYANWVAHFIELLLGREDLSIGKLFMPVQIYLMMSRWGWHGFLLVFIVHAMISVYYFTLALMNHNAEHCVNTRVRNMSSDWGEAQLHSSADWGVGLSFRQASRYLWLNYHTVHHLFPLVDFSHHPAIQQILLRTCAEFGIVYYAGQFWSIYRGMISAFSTPRSLLQEVLVYSGGI